MYVVQNPSAALEMFSEKLLLPDWFSCRQGCVPWLLALSKDVKDKKRKRNVLLTPKWEKTLIQSSLSLTWFHSEKGSDMLM